MLEMIDREKYIPDNNNFYVGCSHKKKRLGETTLPPEIPPSCCNDGVVNPSTEAMMPNVATTSRSNDEKIWFMIIW
jgi:hypothetical protein